MKIVGGPRNGQVVTLAEIQGGPELQISGMILTYTFTAFGTVTVTMSMAWDDTPSVPGLLEKYKCQDGAWHYIAPLATNGFMASPPVIME
jgi:hypothetical protein